MTVKLSDEMRKDLAASFPEIFKKALSSYEAFLEKKDGGGLAPSVNPAKDFSDHHNACKVALAHLELLLKLGDMMGIGSDESAEMIKNLMQEAFDEIENAENDTPEQDDDDA